MVSSPIRFEAFAGRSSEIAHLLARRADAVKGRGGVVLVTGSPGIGKSRLVREFCAQLPRRTTKIAVTGCREFAQRPLAPLLDLLEQLGGGRVALLPTAVADKSEFMATLIERFEAVVGESMTVVVIEDVHWADREALEILLALCSSARTRRLLFVLTYRDADIVPTHPNFSVIGRMLRESAVSLVELPPLSEAEIGGLLRATGVDKWGLSNAILEGVGRRCDGNAFFAEELLRNVVSRVEAGLMLNPASLPLSLHAAVCDRLERASPAARRCLSQASLFGRTFDLAVLQMVFGDASPQSPGLERSHEELVRLDLIERRGLEPAMFRFKHALVRDIVYAEIPAHEARSLHRKIADAILAGDRERRDAETLAHHFWHADDRERAAPFCVTAADRARELHAYVDAADLYERAAHAFANDADAARAFASAAQASFFAGYIDRALALYAQATQRFDRAGLIDDLIIASVLTAGALYENGRASDAAAMLEVARDRWLSLATPPVRDRMLLRLGSLYALTLRAPDAWRCCEAVAASLADHSDTFAAEYEFLRSSLFAQSAEPTAWHESFERAYALFERAGAIADNRRIALSNAALQALHLGETVWARAYQIRSLEVAMSIRSNVDREYLALGEIEFVRGDIRAAADAFAKTIAVDQFLARTDRAVLESWLALALGGSAGTPVAQMRLLTEAETGGHRDVMIRLACAFGRFEQRRGDLASANALFVRAEAAIETTYGLTFAIADLALSRAVSLDRVRPIVARAAQRKYDRVNRVVLSLIDAARLRQRDAPGSVAFARDAADGFGALGWRWLEAQANELAGRRKDALSFYASAGAVGEIRRLERSTIAGITAAPGSLLTPRERDVARIVAGGVGNRGAARQLEISEKAVEKYLTSIYGKLGIASRAQLAAYVADQPDPS